MSAGRFGRPGRVIDLGRHDDVLREFGITPPNRPAQAQQVDERAARRRELDDAQRARHGGPDCDRGPSGVVAYDM